MSTTPVPHHALCERKGYNPLCDGCEAERATSPAAAPAVSEQADDAQAFDAAIAAGTLTWDQTATARAAYEGFKAGRASLQRASSAPADSMRAALEFMLDYENDDERALAEIQSAFDGQTAVRDAQEFARAFVARKMRAALDASPTATPASAQPADPEQAALDAALRQEVVTMYQLLDDGEWAEHVAVTPHGQCLETAITRLVGKAASAQPVAAAPRVPEPSRASRIECALRQIIEADDDQGLTQDLIESGRSALAAIDAAPVVAAPAMLPLSAGLPSPDDHDRVLVYTEGVDFAGEQYFDIRADEFYLPVEERMEVVQAATHWMPRPGVTAAPVVEARAGWKLVPVEPTQQMLDAAMRKTGNRGAKVWEVMLDAAPVAQEGV